MPKEISRLMIAYDDIVIGEDFNPRKSLGDIDSLAHSIEKHGLIQPIVVREGGPAGDGRRKYFLVAGERRYRACGKLKMKQVEIKLIKGDSHRQAQLALVENLHRENLDPLQEAEAMQKYMAAYGLNQAELAKDLEMSAPYVSQRLSLLKKATPEVKEALDKGVITSTHAREIVSLPPEQQKEVVAKIKKEEKETGKKASVAKVKDETDKRKAKIKREKAPDYDKDKIESAKEAYEGMKLEMQTKSAVLEMLGTLIERAQRAKSTESKASIKAQIAFGEWVLGVRDTLG